MPTATDHLEIVKSKTLAALGQEVITRMIRDGELEPGAKLVEADFTRRLDVNRAAVREAFRALEEAGLVKLEKNRGVYVRRFRPDEAVDLYEMRACLEEMGARRLAERITDAQLRQLTEVNARFGTYAEGNCMDEYSPLDIEFHDRLTEWAGNKALLNMYRRLADQMHLVRRRSYQTGEELRKAHAEHDAILKALAARDVGRAGRAARAHALGGMQRHIELEHTFSSTWRPGVDPIRPDTPGVAIRL
jgi:DNA-binding GntR family transcriptional regulator